MEFLAQEVLIEAISKLAALSNSKLFLLLEDSLANRSFAGESELCAAFASGTLVRRENDARVHYDVEDKRCVKTAGGAWAEGGRGRGVGGNGHELSPAAADGSTVNNAFNDEGAAQSLFPRDSDSQSDSLMGDPLGFVDIDRNSGYSEGLAVGGRGNRVGRVDKSLHTLRPSDDSVQRALRGSIPGLQGGIPGLQGSLPESLSGLHGTSQGDRRDPSEESASQRRRVEESIPALGPDPMPSAQPRQKRGGSSGGGSADRDAINKRIKMEPRSRSPSPAESAPAPATEPNVLSLPSISFDVLQEKILNDTTLMSTLSNALKSLSHLPSSNSLPASSSTFLPPSAPSSNPHLKANTRETSSPLSAAPQSSSLFPSPRAIDAVVQHHPASSTASLFPPSDPPSATAKSPGTTPAPSPSRPAAATAAAPSASSSKASPAVSLYSTDATRTIRVKNPNYADPDSVSARFARFGDVLFVSRCGENLQSPVAAAAAAAAAAAGWWTIEFDTVRAAADALLYAREQRGLEAHFEENHEFTDSLWVAYEPEGKLESAEAERSVIEFLRENFSFLGKILRTSPVKFVVEEKEASAVLQFRSAKHVEMIIQKVRGQKLSGTRFQMDVASPLLKDKYFLPQTGGEEVGGFVKAAKPPASGVVAPASGERAPRSSTPSSDDGRWSNGARSNERVDQLPQKHQHPQKQSRQLLQQHSPQQQQQQDQRDVAPLTNPENPRFASSDRGNSSAATPPAAISSVFPATSSKSNSPSPEDRKSRSIKLVLNEKQLTILKKCPVEKLVELFTSYGSVVEVFMPTATRPSFGVEFLDVNAANKAVMAGAASSGAFKAVFDLDASFSSSSAGLWMGGLEMAPGCSALSLRRGLMERFAKFDPRPTYIWLARSKSQTVIEFSTPAIANRVFADLKGDKTRKFDFDLISEKGIKLFVDRLKNEASADNPQ